VADSAGTCDRPVAGLSLDVADWAATCGRPVAGLSLDVADADPSRFLAYLVAAMRTVVPCGLAQPGHPSRVAVVVKGSRPMRPTGRSRAPAPAVAIRGAAPARR